jgi:hypothetical protein
MAAGLMQLVAYGAQDVYLIGKPEVKRMFKINSSTGGKISVKINKNNTLKIKMKPDVKIWDTIPVKIYGVDSTTKKITVKKMIKALEMSRQQLEADQLYDKDITRSFDYDFLTVTADNTTYSFTFDQVKRINLINQDTLKFKLLPTDSLRRIGYNITEVCIFTNNRRTLMERSADLARIFDEGKYMVRYHMYTGEEYIGFASVNSKRNKNGNMLSKTIAVDYIYFGSEERTRFAQASHEYLIEQVQLSKNKMSMTSEFNLTGRCLAMSDNKFEMGTWRCVDEKIKIHSAFVDDIIAGQQAYQQYVQKYAEIEKSKDGFTITHHNENLTTGSMEKVQVARYEKITQGAIVPFPPNNNPPNPYPNHGQPFITPY